MPFEPIAIIGQACVLPGALTPEALWDIALNGKDVLSSVPEGYWRIEPGLVCAAGPGDTPDLAWSDRGGYVRGFESVFDPTGFDLPAEEVEPLDPLVHWLLHTAREALRDAGYGDRSRHLVVGAVFGNLSYPSHGLNRFAESTWLQAQGRRFLDGHAHELALTLRTDPLNRFNSGLPAHVLARALALKGGAFALDAACASSLYAVKLACDRLHDGQADVMLAGGVNRADDLFLHVGFSALQALSRTGQSRPFHRHADGLVPAEGAGFVVLKRLRDAVNQGDGILGVIRAVGLSNDGRGHGLLVPFAEGQERAIRQGYALSGLRPADISLVEAHATGTVVGDGVEIQSMSAVYRGLQDVPIGTIKSNLGHPITVSGVAGVIKVLGAIRAGIRPPTLHADPPIEILKGSPFRLLNQAEPWEVRSGPRRAAINNFGFGGNNAHLILEAWDERRRKKPLFGPASPPLPPQDVAIVGMGAIVADAAGVPAFAEALFSGRSGLRVREGGGPCGFADDMDLPLIGLRFPPADLDETLAQQLMILKVALEALAGVDRFPADRAGTLIGMGCDAEVARCGFSWRMPQFLKDWIPSVPAEEVREWAADAGRRIRPLRKSAGILGAMPNIPANRLCSQFDLQRLSFTVSAEELSGVRALELALRALRANEIDAAIVGAVDLCCEIVQRTAAAQVFAPERQVPGDAAVVMILKRLEDARRDGDTVCAVLPAQPDDLHPDLHLGLGGNGMSLTPRFGHAHAASGLVHTAAAALACYCRLRPGGQGGPWVPWPRDRGPRAVCISVEALGGQAATVVVTEDPQDGSRPGRHDAWRDRLRALTRLHEHNGTQDPSVQAPSRTYAVHPPPVELPGLTPALRDRMRAAPAGDGDPRALAGHEAAATLRMAPAPWLPPVLEETKPEGVDVPELTGPRPAAPPATEVPVEGPTEPAPRAPDAWRPGSSPLERALGEVVAQSRLMAAVHQDFLHRQAQVHRQFLKLRNEALAVLAQGPQAAICSVEPAAAPLPAGQAPPAGPDCSPGAPPPVHEAPAGAALASQAVALPSALPFPVSAQGEAVAPGTATRVRQPPKPSALDALRSLFENPEYLPPEGPAFDREQLKILASGKISDVFGPLFEQQDDYLLQVRLPEEPLLLADRITGLDAEAGSMGQGTIWTETDVTEDAWYLQDGYMPGGIMIESGQCDLALMSYLGIDFLNKGERVYRLLGCDLLFHGPLPRVGETLCYQIHVDGHARMGEQRVFFFRYDCRVNGALRLSVRNGQAAFITHEEARNAGGVLWNPETGEHKPPEDSRLDPPEAVCGKTRFSREEVTAFSEGRAHECFGQGFERLATHARTPKIPRGRLCLLHEVTDCDPRGGPWGRGYIRVENRISPDDWFLAGHFKNDPCMPGTLMTDACMQTLAFYLAALGFTIRRDGWRFEPVPHEIYQAKCRSQVTPDSRKLTYEAFVEEVMVVDGLHPTVYADVLATVDGKKSLHIRRLGIQLVPDWPLDGWPHLLKGHVEKKPAARIGDLECGYRSLLACAFGRPSEAYGDLGKRFDKGRYLARLPGPPYQFMTRVTRIDADPGAMKPNQTVEVEYDVPAEGWYFTENGDPTMPHCVLMEAALQPCGWLAVFSGGPAATEEDLHFRNLDGEGTLRSEVLPAGGTILTRTTLTNLARFSGQILLNFDVDCSVDGQTIYAMKTGFGFFSQQALAEQVGLVATADQVRWLEEPCDFRVDLTSRPDRYFGRELVLPGPMLLMLDRVTGYWPEEGGRGLGRLRAEKTVDIGEWFFKAHFFQDPVQPGSLGVESMVQLLQFYMLHEEMHQGIRRPRFLPLSLNHPVTWKYRGQVTPEKKRISIEMNILERGRDGHGAYAVAEAWLWADALRIFHVKNLKMHIVSGGNP